MSDEHLNFKIDDKETPLDVIIELIKKNSIDIYDIPIAELTDQFMAYVNSMEKRDMESMSSFIVMASELVRIKSKMLLPKDVNEDEEDEDPRQELVNRIIEYKKYKFAAEKFKEMDLESNDIFFKKAETGVLTQLKLPIHEEVNEILGDVTMRSLYAVFEDVLMRSEKKAKRKKRTVKFNRMRFSIEERIEHIRNLLIISNKMLFRNIFEYGSSKMEVIVTFSAMLELIKLKEIRVEQENIFSDIYIYGNI